jgi:hypothetical protein
MGRQAVLVHLLCLRHSVVLVFCCLHPTVYRRWCIRGPHGCHGSPELLCFPVLAPLMGP